MRAAKPAVTTAIAKLNDGVAGRGNAVVNLRELPVAGRAEERVELARRVEAMEFEDSAVTLPWYLSRFGEDGGIVEERVGGVEIRSPSVQLRVTPLGEVELLSTHDQLLGGPSGQTYLGCRFPADFGYARAITQRSGQGRRAARAGGRARPLRARLRRRARHGRGWTPYAIEVNLRKGGTTHPFLTLQFLTDGEYDPATALFIAPSGREKHLVATDHLEDDRLRGVTLDDLFDVAVRHGLQFHQARQTGVVFHMMGGLAELGQVGLTAVGDSRDHADTLFRRAERVIREEAAPAPEPSLPPL